MGATINGTLNVNSGSLMDMAGSFSGTGTVNWNGGTIKAEADVDLQSLSGFNNNSGGVLELDGSTTQTLSAKSAGQTLPAILHSGASTATISTDSTTLVADKLAVFGGGSCTAAQDTLTVTNVDVSEGTLVLKSGASAVTGTGAGLTGTITNLEGTTFTVTNFYANTSSVNASSTWTVAASGEAIIRGTVTVAYCTSSGAAPVTCPHSDQTDGGNNSNVVFTTDGFKGNYLLPRSLEEETHFGTTCLVSSVYAPALSDYAGTVLEVNIDSGGWQPVLVTGGLGTAGSGVIGTTRYAKITPSANARAKASGYTIYDTFSSGAEVQFRGKPVDSDGNALTSSWTDFGTKTTTADISNTFIVNFSG